MLRTKVRSVFDSPGDMKAPLQEISVDSSQCWTPHLLGTLGTGDERFRIQYLRQRFVALVVVGVNEVNGDLYVACVGANSAVWRYTYNTAE